MKILRIAKFVVFFVFCGLPALADKPVLTIYTYDSFTSDWGPGPAVETEFEKICECDLQFVGLDSSIGILGMIQLEGKTTKADIVSKLKPYLPVSRVEKTPDGNFILNYNEPKSIGYIAPFYGNFGILVRAYAYILSLGSNGLLGTSNRAVLNANYLQEKMRPLFGAPYRGRCMHEFVFSGEFLKEYGVNVLDLAKGLIDYGFHPPTIYFPLNVPEAIMIEPTETEDRDMLDNFVEKVSLLIEQARKNANVLHNAPKTTPVSRLDEKKAAKDMRLNYS